MKRIFFIAMTVLPLMAHARDIPARTFQVSGSTTLDFLSEETDIEGFGTAFETDRWQVRGAAGYYLIPNLAIGLELRHESSEVTAEGTKIEDSSTELGPQVFFNIGVSEKASLQLKGGLLFAKKELGDGTEFDGFGMNVGAGLSYFVHQIVSLDAMLGYRSVSFEDDAGEEFDESGFGLGLGVSVYLGGK